MANTLKFGNGEWATKEGSTLAFNDENGNFKPLPFDFVRDTTATRVNKEGLIEVVGNNEPRIDYKDNTKGALLLEPTRTNYDSESTNFSTSFMSNNAGIQSSSLVSNIAPDGSINSIYKISKVTDNSDPYIGRSGVSFTNTSMVFSVWLWTDENQPKDVLFLVYRDGVEEIQTKNITLTTTPTRYFIEASFTTTPSNVAYRIDLTANSSNQYIYAWGKQLEQGSYATSYIPTSGGIGTRDAESSSQTTPDGVIGKTEGVLYAEVSTFADNTYKRISLNNGSYVNSILFDFVDDNNLYGKVFVGGSPIATILASGLNIENINKLAFKYKQNDFALWVNGVEVGVDTTGSTPSGLNKVGLDLAGNQDFIGNVKDVRVYNTALTDQELQVLTS